MRQIKSDSISNMTPEQIKSIVLKLFKPGDRIHVTKKSRKPINNVPAIFKSAYNRIITVEAYSENYLGTFTITYSELYTGDFIIHELLDKIRIAEPNLES